MSATQVLARVHLEIKNAVRYVPIHMVRTNVHVAKGIAFMQMGHVEVSHFLLFSTI